MKRTPFKRKTPWSTRSKAPKTPKVKRDRVESIKSLKKRTWVAVSLFVRKRDGYRCVTCGATGVNMDCGHYRHNSERSQSLGGNALWYDLRNLNCQCAFYCNKNLSGNLTKYALFLEEKYGHGILQEFNSLYKTYKKWTREELLGIIERCRLSP